MRKEYKKLIEGLIASKRAEENRKYGEFIIQTNEVQFLLSFIVLKRTSLPDKKYIEDLEKSELGILIKLFQACGNKTPQMFELMLNLKSTTRLELS